MKVAVIGLARSGYAAAKLALALGYSVKVSDGCNGTHMSEETCREIERKSYTPLIIKNISDTRMSEYMLKRVGFM